MRRLLMTLWLTVALELAAAQTPRPATPLDPIPAILNAFQNHAIVALSEGQHNNDQSFAFRMALLRDPRFVELVNDIVVESGSSKYQDLMDRFVGGESVPDKELRRAWQDTTQPDAVWDVPMYETFFREVRKINSALPREKHIRVLLGDPPFDWEHGTREEWLSLDRDLFAANLIQREVLAKKHKALVVYGNNHLGRRGHVIGGRLADACGPCLFSIWTHTSGKELAEIQPNVADWPMPTLSLIADTVLGAMPYPQALPGDATRLEDYFDAVLYVGPVAKLTTQRDQIPAALCADAQYMSMRMARMADPPDRPLPPGVQSPAMRLKQHCASITAK